MSIFGREASGERYGAIIDIGSGSVLTAIVHSKPQNLHPHIIWSHREHAALRNIDSLEQSAKAVMSALVSAGMILDSNGRRALNEYQPDAIIRELQCSIAAPWSYTVTKSLHYQQEEPFLVTKELIAELTSTIRDQIHSDLNENDTLRDLDLEIIAQGTLQLTANGYQVPHPEGQWAKQLQLVRGNAIAQRYLIEAITDLRNKLLARAKVHSVSFLFMMYLTCRELMQNMHDICLVDVTYEATEIGVVRNGALTYCTHAPFGAFSLAREIAAITDIPLHEAFGYFHSEQPFAFAEKLNKKQQAEVEKVFDAYSERIAELFQQTGDTLAIPKRIALHTDIKTESFFRTLIGRASKRTLKSDAVITSITKEIIRQTYAQTMNKAPKSMPTDTALLLSAQFFHKRQQYGSLEYL